MHAWFCMIIRILRDVYTSSLYNVFGSDSKHDDGMVLVNIQIISL